MSDYPPGEWQAAVDGHFWRFMHIHRGFFVRNPRLALLVKSFDRMPAEKQKLHLFNAERYLKKLDED